jgi:hypothetical protein
VRISRPAAERFYARSLLAPLAALAVLMGSLSFAASPPAGASSDPSSAGTEFWFAFPPAPDWLIDGGFNYAISRRLFISAESGATGIVSVPGLNDLSIPFTVSAGGLVEVDLMSGQLDPSGRPLIDLPTRVDRDPARAPFDGVVELGINVTASDPISVYAIVENDYFTDAFLALPVTTLGREYWVLSYATGGSGAAFAVVATEDDTTVTVASSIQTTNRTAGVGYEVSLDRGEVYVLVDMRAEFSGTRIISDKPVGVISSDACTSVAAGACDTIVSMLPPVKSWGREFAVMNLAGREESGHLLRVMAARNSTTVIIDREDGTSETVTLDAGEFVATPVLVDEAASVRADRPVMVAQFATGDFNGDIGDPFMTLVPPSPQFLTAYTVGVAGERFVVGSPAVANHWASLITTAAGRDQVRVAGDPVSAFTSDEWKQLTGTLFGINVNLENQAYRIETSGEPLGVNIYGFRDYESYAYPGGMAFRAIVPEILSMDVSTLLIDAQPFPKSVEEGSETETETETRTATPTQPILTFVPQDGGFPQVAVGSGSLQSADGSVQPLTVSSPGLNQVRYQADGIQVTFTGGAGTDARRGLIANGAGEVVCEICAALAAGQVIEAWMFSEPRLVAAWRIEDLPCQRFTIPVVAPLDGRGPIPPGAHTLQLALPTAGGMQAVNVGVTVGPLAPTSVQAGEGPAGEVAVAWSRLLLLVGLLAGVGIGLPFRRRRQAAAS